MIYKFKIDNDHLAEEQYFGGVSGNKNVYLCEFNITCDENSAVWFAVFKKDGEVYIVPVSDGQCSIPYEVLENPGIVYLGCYAECEGEKRISTNWLPLSVEEGAYSDGTAPQPPSEDLWEILLKNSVPVIGENGNWFTYDITEQGYADTGFCARGEHGQKGEKGDTGAAGYTPQKGIDYFTQADISEIAQNFEPTDTKQDTLISGENIKTVNGESILGSGNLNILEGVCNTPYDAETNKLATMADIAKSKRDLKVWKDVQAIVREGSAAEYFSIGDQFAVEKLSNLTVSKGTSTGISTVTVDADAFISGMGETKAGTYVFTYDGKAWRDGNGKVADFEDYGILVTGRPIVGDNVAITETTSQLIFDIIGIDHDIPANPDYIHSMTLQLHNALPERVIFDAAEAAWYIDETAYPNGLIAGTYNFTWNYTIGSMVNGTYQFTLTQDVPPGGQIVIGTNSSSDAITSCKIKTYSSVGDTNPIESNVAILSGSDGTSLGTITSISSANGIINCAHRIMNGSDNWSESSIRQWLNAEGAANTWWTPKNVFDRPLNSNQDGFLRNIDPAFLKVIGEVTKMTQMSIADGYGLKTSAEKFFLLSRAEVYAGAERAADGADGMVYPYYGAEYSDLTVQGMGTDSNRVKYRGSSPAYWWLRTARADYAHALRGVYGNGGISDLFAYRGAEGYDVAPACVII